MKKACKKVPGLCAGITALVGFSVLLSSCGIYSRVEVGDASPALSGTAATAVTVTVPTRPDIYTEGDNDKPVPEEQLALLPEADYGNRYFLIMTDGSDNTVFPDAGAFLAKAAAERITAVENRYNIRIKKTERDPDSLDESAGKTYFADLMLLPLARVSGLSAAGICENLTGAAFYNADAPYFNELTLPGEYDAVKDLCVGADILYNPLDAYCVFYNRELVNRETVTALVYGGGWNGASFAALAGAGGLVCDSPDSDGRLKEFEKFYTDGQTRSAAEAFAAGDAAFLIAPVSLITSLSGSGMSFGILPLPADDSGTFRGYTGGTEGLSVFCIPKSRASGETSVIIMSALAAAACETNKSAAKEYLKGYVTDNSSYLMLDYIFADVN